MKLFLFCTLSLTIINTSCGDNNKTIETPVTANLITNDSAVIVDDSSKNDTLLIPIKELPTQINNTDTLVAFAKTLIGIPYLYASTNPSKGFDCSGFITYVFSHFNIQVPRSSIDFTNYGKEVDAQNAVAGNLILFTGTDSTSKVVGHMGIITQNINGEIQFIHSTSGKANGVTITPLNLYYKKRFVKIIKLS
ncbi:MAG: C40 family peptidase [Chitinophagaceae bacterium]|nr:C40 family peptidase [Chitinophagaceae bacterium]MBP6430755.1 C40 family peptidase [Ferruginibacter sp.]